MPDLTDLLDRTTPTDLPPPDIPGLARRARHRRARHRAAVATAVVLPTALLAVAVAGLRDDRPPTYMGAGGIELTEPVGSWTAGAPSPLGPRIAEVFSGVLGDGRVLLWGGTSENGDDNDDIVIPHADGAIYDPDTDTWETIPAAPLPPIATGGRSITTAQISHDRLAVVTGTPGSTAVSAAVYDVAERTWTEAPAQDEIPAIYDGMTWDGTTLALVRLEDGSRLDDPAARVDEPVTLRWTPGDDSWTIGAPPPLSLRFGAGHDATPDGRLALWGGIDGTGRLADGAVYDVQGDAWTDIATGPLAGRIHPSLHWSGGRLMVGGGLDRLDDVDDYLPDGAWYDPASGSWEPIADAPLGGPADQRNGGDHVIAESTSGHSGPQPVWFLGPEGWEEAPLSDLHTVADLTVATSVGLGNPGDGPFTVEVRADRDVWLDAPDAPFTNRMAGAVEASGTKLVVIGGREGSAIQTVTDTWVLDLAAGQNPDGTDPPEAAEGQEVVAFLARDITENERAEVERWLTDDPRVTRIRYHDQDDSLAEYRETFRDNPEMLEQAEQHPELVPVSYRASLADGTTRTTLPPSPTT